MSAQVFGFFLFCFGGVRHHLCRARVVLAIHAAFAALNSSVFCVSWYVIFGLALMQQIQKYWAAEVSRAATLSNRNEAPPESEEAAAEWHGYSSSPLVCVGDAFDSIAIVMNLTLAVGMI
jgi:hypothetical protein